MGHRRFTGKKTDLSNRAFIMTYTLNFPRLSLGAVLMTFEYGADF